ncbi:MAG: hypothetical protein EAX81_02470 [Candidatus Thorarchaeota archaeon]|nr:hypothetical protein [Candidatus Thorarchaeota archaeon]
MITPQMSTIPDTRERVRKAITDYLAMFLPGSWTEPLVRLKLLLQSNSEIDWDALKGHSLAFFDEQRLAQDRIESLARIERFVDAFKDLYKVLSPAEWHKAVDDIFQAANFRVSKAALSRPETRFLDERKKESSTN